MFQLNACTVCFATDVKLVHIDGAYLRHDFNWVSGIQSDPANGMPEYLCIMCATFVRNCKKFREKCHRAHYALLQLLRRNKQVNVSHLKAIDTKKLGVASNLSFMNLKNHHYKQIQFKWVNYNRIGVREAAVIPVATCSTIEDVIEEVPIINQAKPLNAPAVDTGNIKLELQFESIEQVIQFEDTVTKEEIVGNAVEKNDDLFDNEPINDNEDSCAVDEDVHNWEQDVDGADDKLEYATLILATPAEAKAAVELVKSFSKGDHRCDVCNRGYFNKARLDVHQRMHDKYMNGFFLCELCQYYYKTEFLLQSHYKEKHMYKYICRKCPEVSFNRTTAKQHYIKTHMTNEKNKTGEWYKRRPSWLYRNGGDMRVKRSKTSDVRSTSTTTESQGKRYKVPPDFPIATPVRHEDQYRLILERKNSKNYLEAEHKCQFCYRGFRELGPFNNHMKKHNPEISGNAQCDMCKLYFKNARKVYKHMTNTHIYKYSCQVCKFFCYNKNQATSHYKWHNNVTYNCPHCTKVFKKVSTQLTHIRLKHPSLFICNLCGHSFVSEAGLRCHKRITHSDEESAAASLSAGPSCAECGVRFVSEMAYRTHLDSSTNHTATVTATRRKSDPNSVHRRVNRGRKDIHNNGVATGNNCEVCGKFLMNDVQARQHYETEHPGTNFLKRYMCDVCGHTTKQYANLMVHMRTHTREKPYSCPHCDRKFSMPSNRDRHIVVHTGEKRYQCQHCSRRFTQSSAVKLHIQTVHLKIPYAPWDKKTRKRRKELEGQGPIAISNPECIQPTYNNKVVLDTQSDYLNAYITYNDD